MQNRVKALVATPALGMGFDKPDIGFVIHYQAPGSVVAYYQQVGRAGRAIPSAYGILLSGEEDAEITDFFIESAFPTRAEVAEVIRALEGAPNGLSVPELMAQVNLSMGRIRKTIDLLALELPSPIAKQGHKWQLTAARLSDGFWHRAERLTNLRRVEQQQMQEYVDLRSGHMDFLIRGLDGTPSETVTSGLAPLPAVADAALVREAVAFLKRTSLPLEPRKKWPAGGMPRYRLKGVIPAAERVQPGRALSIWADAGWGRAVKEQKYHQGRFSDELVNACAGMVRSLESTACPHLGHVYSVVAPSNTRTGVH